MKDEEKKVNEEVQTEEEGKELTDEELAKVSGGVKLDPERLRRKVEEAYASY